MKPQYVSALNELVSFLYTSFPSRNRMAPKKPTFFRVDDATQQDLYIQVVPTFGTWIHVAGNELRPKTKDQCRQQGHIQRFFLKASCLSGSALAIRGRGFLSQKPSRRNKRWH